MEGRRLAPWPAALGALLLLGAVMLVAWLASVQPLPAQRVVSAHAAPAPTSASPLRGGVERPTGPEATAPPQPSEAEVCGIGIVREGSAQAAALAARYADSEDRSILLHLAAMRASPDAATRAAGAAVLRDAASLAAMALHSRDPTVYTFALQACAGAADPHCALLSPEQLARLDPDNAASWLRVAHAAAMRRDAAGVAEAMHHASVSPRIEFLEQRFEALALAVIPDSAATLDKAVLATAMVGSQAAFEQSAYHDLSRYCTPARMTDANLRQTCEALARLLVGHGRSMLELAIGQKIGADAGWPDEQQEAISARLHAYGQRLLDATAASPGREMSCAMLERTLALRHEVASRGERAVLDAELQEGGWV